MKKLIEVKDLAYAIPHFRQVINNLSFEVGPSEFLGVLGHNGAGKSTLLDLLLGIRSTEQGLVRVLGEDPKLEHRQHRDKITYLSHEASLKGNITVRQFLDFSAAFYPAYAKDEEARFLELFKLRDDDKLGGLSTGQQKKVQFTAAAAALPELLIIDEVTAVFDPEFRKLFFAELARLRDLHRTSIVLATNIVDDLVNFSDRVLFLKDGTGKFHAPGDVSKLFSSEAA